MFVAVVVRASEKVPVSRRGDGTFAAFVGEVESDVVTNAIEAARVWNRGNNAGYGVLVGELTARAITPIKYKLVKI